MKILKKITAKDLGAKEVAERVKKEGKELLVGAIFGIATGGTTGTTDLGPYVKFKGEFMAQNAAGEQFKSGIAILPSVVDEAIAGKLANSDSGVEFAFEISIRPDPGSVGFKYSVTELIQSRPSNPMVDLMAKLPTSYGAKLLEMPSAPVAQISAPVQKEKQRKTA